MSDCYMGELEDLQALEEGLSDWEMDFIDSINQYLDNGYILSEKQIDKIHQIWDRVC